MYIPARPKPTSSLSMSSFVWVLEYPANHVFQMSYNQQDDGYGGGDNYGERRGGGRGERRQEEYGNQDNYGSGQQGGYSGGQQDYGSQGGQGGYGGGREQEYGVWTLMLPTSFVFVLFFILETYAESHYFRVKRDAMKVTIDVRREDTVEVERRNTEYGSRRSLYLLSFYSILS